MPRLSRLVHVLGLACLPLAAAAADGPFQFRDAFLLELRIAHSGEEFSASDAQELLSRTGPSPTLPFRPDRGDPRVYTTSRWTDLLEETERFRRMGGLELAEKQLLDMLGRLRAARGAASDEVVALQDHLGELYLEARNPDRAYAQLAAAAATLKTLIDARPAGPAAGRDPALVARQLRLADITTRLGQIDLARGDLAAATAELAAANAIGNESPTHRLFVGSLYATYFLSLALERQGKAAEAEELWRAAVKGRETVATSMAYWNALKEQAAFYARRGDFREAAGIARRVVDGTAGKRLRPELPAPYPLDPRFRIENPQQPQVSLYTAESDVAMSEIVAVDRWRADGPDAAAPLLGDPLQPFRFWLDHGADSERAELYGWLARRIFLHMSILLDGNVPPERIEKAYALLAQVKGRYLASSAAVIRAYEPDRGNPGVQVPELLLLDRLAEARAHQAHLFMATALDGRPADAGALIAGENRERLLTEALSAHNNSSSVFSVAGLARSVPDDAALVDTVVWERTDRGGATHREVGAFVVRQGQPVRYVVLGAAAEIEADIAGLETGVVDERLRGATILGGGEGVAGADVPALLAKLHRRLIAPMAPFLAGARSLLIVADGKLALAPFAALVDPDGHALLERQTVTYLASWRDLYVTVLYGKGPTSPPVVVGNPDYDATLPGPPAEATRGRTLHFEPLPEAEKEAAEVAAALRITPDRILLGARAREDLVRSLVGPEILHFATHSVPNLAWQSPVPAAALFEFPRPLATEDPFLRSAIALAGANRAQGGPEDGLLTGLEVESLHLSGTRLVVLSSCKSGQGVPVDGEGVLGLRAAFATAGADAVVMSLWPVSDEAGRELMHLFYANLAAGPAEALRRAQLAMRAEPRFANPFFWAGYVVSATPRPARAERPARAAPPSAPLLAPACFQMATRSDRQPYHSFWDTIRVRWGGSVTKKSSTADTAVYQLLSPGGDVEYRYSTIAPNGAAMHDSLTRRASQYNCPSEGFACRAVTLTVHRDARGSSILIQSGEPARISILLAGPPGLFPSLELPEKLPPVSATTEAWVWEGEKPTDKATDKQPIETIGPCVDQR